MKVTLCLAVICAFAAYTQAEQCRTISECGHVTCPESDYTLECHLRQCTCTQQGSSSGCRTASECSGSDCRFGWHCVDQKCRCGWGIGK